MEREARGLVWVMSWDGGYRRWASLIGWWILQHQQAAVRGVSGGHVSPVLYDHYALLYLYASIHIIHIYPKASITKAPHPPSQRSLTSLPNPCPQPGARVPRGLALAPLLDADVVQIREPPGAGGVHPTPLI
ncbi:hypothetical protein O988_09533, partial [Pseudogymnoascus sp. VKM F-3808]